MRLNPVGHNLEILHPFSGRGALHLSLSSLCSRVCINWPKDIIRNFWYDSNQLFSSWHCKKQLNGIYRLLSFNKCFPQSESSSCPSCAGTSHLVGALGSVLETNLLSWKPSSRWPWSSGSTRFRRCLITRLEWQQEQPSTQLMVFTWQSRSAAPRPPEPHSNPWQARLFSSKMHWFVGGYEACSSLFVCFCPSRKERLCPKSKSKRGAFRQIACAYFFKHERIILEAVNGVREQYAGFSIEEYTQWCLIVWLTVKSE